MPRKILFIAVLAIAASYAGGQASVQTPQPTQPATNAQPFGGPLLVTPTMTLPTPQPTAGISDAGRAGISVNPETAPRPWETSTGEAAGATASGTEVGSAAATAGETGTGDLLPSTFVGEAPAASGSMSVAEASDRFKASKGAQNARMLTNDEVEKILGGRTGVTVARNMPPLGPGVPSGVAQSATAENAASPSQSSPSPSTSAQAVQSSAAGDQQAQNAASQQRQRQPSADNATTPQINPNQQSNDSAGRSRLPATSTFLPLLGLLGLVSGGLGLWFRKFRR